MSELSSQEVTAGISRKAIASFQRNSKNGHKPATLEDHLAGKAIGTPEKTSIVDTWNRNLDLIGNKRLILPPKVADTIVRHRDSLTARSRSNSSRAVARERMLRGDLPGFMRKRGEPAKVE